MISISYYDFGKRKITTPYPRFPLSDNKNKAVIFIFLLSGYFVISHPQIVLWCNGSTTDSGPVCPSSNLGKTTKAHYPNPLTRRVFLFYKRFQRFASRLCCILFYYIVALFSYHFIPLYEKNRAVRKKVRKV